MFSKFKKSHFVLAVLFTGLTGAAVNAAQPRPIADCLRNGGELVKVYFCNTVVGDDGSTSQYCSSGFKCVYDLGNEGPSNKVSPLNLQRRKN